MDDQKQGMDPSASGQVKVEWLREAWTHALLLEASAFCGPRKCNLSAKLMDLIVC